MKTKLYLLLLMLAGLAACNTNEPEKKELVGTWSELYHVSNMVKAITFFENDTLIYTYKPDTTWNVVIDYAGKYAKLHYSVKNHKLHISGYTYPYPSADTKQFSYMTGYSIDGNTLTIDSFSYNGGFQGDKFYKPLILYKQ